MGTVAYTLREEYAGTVDTHDEHGDYIDTRPVFGGGLLSIDNLPDFDVAAQLADGAGTIVVSDADAYGSAVIRHLDNYPPVERATVPDATVPTVTPYDNWSASELKAEAGRRDIDGASRLTKADAIAALVDYDRNPPAPAIPTPQPSSFAAGTPDPTDPADGVAGTTELDA